MNLGERLQRLGERVEQLLDEGHSLDDALALAAEPEPGALVSAPIEDFPDA